MAHERKKKDGERKDKKMERMRAAVADRKAHATPHVSTDQADIIPYKSGSEEDASRNINRPQ